VTQELPDASFQVLVSTFATQAAMALGQIPNPVTDEADEDLEQAKFAIDLLQVMDEKTQGNRTAEEDKFLQDCLYQLRMVYIDKSAKKDSKQ
jgi:hypothetical protein